MTNDGQPGIDEAPPRPEGPGGAEPAGEPLVGLATPVPEAAAPARSRPTVRARLTALVEVLACSGFPTQFAIAGVLALAGIRPFDAAGRLSTAYVFTLSVADAVAMVALVAWFLRLHGEHVAGVLLGPRPLLREGLLGVLQIPFVFLLVLTVMATLHYVAPWMHNVAKNPMEELIATRLDAVLFVLVAIAGGGIREEVQRAFILHRFDVHLGGGWLGLSLFSVLFGAGHIIQGRDVAVATAALGFFWGVVYLRRRSIASTVVCHSGFNALEIVRFALFRA